MSGLIIIIMQQNQYPFGQCDNSHLTKKKVMVKKIIDINSQQKIKIITKTKKIKSLSNPYLIKLQQLLQQDETLHLLYEYVPIKIETWIQNLNTEFIETFQSKIMQLANYFVINHIVIDFKIKNIGMDQSYNPKYFIGFDFQINKQVSLKELLDKYQKQIKKILYPHRNQAIINQIQKNQYIQSQRNKIKQLSKSQPYYKTTTERSVKQFILQKKSQRIVHYKIQNQQTMKLGLENQQHQKPKNIPVRLKIQNISRKIQDLKLIVNGYNKKGRPQSTKKNLHKNYQENILIRQSSGNVLKYDKNQYKLIFLDKPRQTRQTQSENQYEYRYLQKKNINERVVSQRQLVDNKNYFQEFENLFDNKQQPLISPENVRKQQDKDNKNITTEYFHVQTQKVQPNKKQITKVKRRKRSGGSLVEQRFITLSRMHEVLNTSKNLINKFKKPNLI